MLHFLSYDDKKILNLTVIKHILKDYAINRNNEFEMRYKIKELIKDDFCNRITFALKAFPLIEENIIRWGIKLIESNTNK